MSPTDTVSAFSVLLSRTVKRSYGGISGWHTYKRMILFFSESFLIDEKWFSHCKYKSYQLEAIYSVKCYHFDQSDLSELTISVAISVIVKNHHSRDPLFKDFFQVKISNKSLISILSIMPQTILLFSCPQTEICFYRKMWSIPFQVFLYPQIEICNFSIIIMKNWHIT